MKKLLTKRYNCPTCGDSYKTPEGAGGCYRHHIEIEKARREFEKTASEDFGHSYMSEERQTVWHRTIKAGVAVLKYFKALGGNDVQRRGNLDI